MIRKLFLVFQCLILVMFVPVQNTARAEGFLDAITCPACDMKQASAVYAGLLVSVGSAMAYADAWKEHVVESTQKAVRDTAVTVWNGASTAVKDSWNASVQTAVATKSKVITMSGDVVNWWKSKSQTMALPTTMAPTASLPDATYVEPVAHSYPIYNGSTDTGTSKTVSTHYPATRTQSTSDVIWTFPAESPYVFVILDAGGGYAAGKTLRFRGADTNPTTYIQVSGTIVGLVSSAYVGQVSVTLSTNYGEGIKRSDLPLYYTLEEVLPHLTTYAGKTYVLPRVEFEEWLERQRKAITANPIGTATMPLTAEGTLVLPAPWDFSKPIMDITGKLRWNADAQTWETLDGVPYTGTGTVDVAVPFPRIVTIDGVEKLVVPISGELVDVANPTTTYPDTGTGGNPPTGGGSTKLPWYAIGMAFLDLLWSMLKYLARLIVWLTNLPLIDEKVPPLDPKSLTMFNYVKSFKVHNIPIWQTLLSLVTLVFSLTVYRIVRRV